MRCGWRDGCPPAGRTAILPCMPLSVQDGTGYRWPVGLAGLEKGFRQQRQVTVQIIDMKKGAHHRHLLFAQAVAEARECLAAERSAAHGLSPADALLSVFHAHPGMMSSPSESSVQA
ncbi:Hypothetical protein GbCGDNIH3_2271 [Granulibacter bethesdensis]|uniref:Uncharacterized protein n=2 Tax=Granulibacter bethesdensis TaxID=364410 RepID=A0AAN0VGY5_9PROT|nr:Hypothetical protein GbCGDNIH3_2271 [Granulibacter bethesdensis]